MIAVAVTYATSGGIVERRPLAAALASAMVVAYIISQALERRGSPRAARIESTLEAMSFGFAVAIFFEVVWT